MCSHSGDEEINWCCVYYGWKCDFLPFEKWQLRPWGGAAQRGGTDTIENSYRGAKLRWLCSLLHSTPAPGWTLVLHQSYSPVTAGAVDTVQSVTALDLEIMVKVGSQTVAAASCSLWYKEIHSLTEMPAKHRGKVGTDFVWGT